MNMVLTPTLGIIFMDFWWVVIPGVLLGMYAQMKLSSVFGHFSRIPVSSGMTGAQAARQILNRANLEDVDVLEIPGKLSDHYDPLKRRLCLSQEVYHGRSIAALGVAAHEAGHALQHQSAYAPLHLRMALVPITQFASGMYMFIFLAGIAAQVLLNATGVMDLCLLLIIGIFSIITLFQLITLPVEFDASSRAKKVLFDMGMISPQERSGVSKVLGAAAMTYVAAMVTSMLQLLQFVLIFLGRRN